MTDQAIVHVNGAGVTDEGTQLLAPTSFAVHPGTAVAVTGSNGSGKTTLLNAIAGLTRPTTGSITVAGRAVDERDPRFRATLAALIGPPPMADNLTLREHLVLVGTSWGLAHDDVTRRAEHMLADLSIGWLATRFPHELSAGQRQLFALALTLSRPYDLLLLDEPEQRLDGERLGLVAQVLRGVVDGGKTIVFATHSSELISVVADQSLALVSSHP